MATVIDIHGMPTREICQPEPERTVPLDVDDTEYEWSEWGLELMGKWGFSVD